MKEHARRHDPDQITRSEVQPVRPAPAHGEPPAELRREHPVPPASAQPGVPSRPSGFWHSLTIIERAEFLATAEEVAYPAGAVLWKEGEAADHTIVIKSGSVRVCVERDGRERIIAFRGPGDIIGERAALLLRRRSATIVAMEPLHALRLTTQQFVTYLSNHPRVVAVMEREMYERLTEQSGSMQGPQVEQYGAAYSYGPAVRYGSPQMYAMAYIPIPPFWPYDPYAAPASGPRTAPAPHATVDPNRPTDPYAAADPYAITEPYTVADPYAVTDPYAMDGPYGVSGPYTATADPQTRVDSHTRTDLYTRTGSYAVAGRPYTPPRPSPAPHRSTPPGPSWAGQNCTIVFTDIAGFSSRVRGENDRIEVRHAMYAALRESFQESGAPWDVCHCEDRGDGALIVVPPEIPTATVMSAVAALGARLRRHNHRSSEAVRIQLRVAVDVGPVMPDPPGVSGWAIINAARLLDAAPLKERLAATGADLGVIASRFVYDSVIAHGHGYVNADEYEPIGCRVKETDIEGWIHLRGLPARSAV